MHFFKEGLQKMDQAEVAELLVTAGKRRAPA